MAETAGRIEDRVAFGILTTNNAMSDGISLFDAGHNNTTTGAIDETSLGAAFALFAGQTDEEGNSLDIEPGVLICPAALRATAESAVSAMQRANVSNSRPVRVTASGILDADSTTQWYMATDPQLMAVAEVAFVDGRTTPRLSSDTRFDSDEMRIKVTHDFGATALDWRAAIRSSGA